jgi:uncharacterized protein YuzE
MDAMTVTIGDLTFDVASYDEDGDVSYLHVGERQVAADSEETPEGHVLRFDAAGRIIGLTIINVTALPPAQRQSERNSITRTMSRRSASFTVVTPRGCWVSSPGASGTPSSRLT